MKRLLMISIVAGVVLAVSGMTQAATINVPTDYTTIQAAIAAANSGDTIIVAASVYNEKLVIDKSVQLFGEQGAVLDGTGLSEEAVRIKSGDVTFDGFEVRDFTLNGIGILVGYEANPPGNLLNVHITNNKIHDISHPTHGFGIYVGYESEGFNYDPPHLIDHLDYLGLLISGNEVYNTSNAVLVMQSITASSGTLDVLDNNFHHAGASGIWIDSARQINVHGNNIQGNTYGTFLSSYAEAWYTLNGPYGPKNITFTDNNILDTVNFGLGLFNGWPSMITVNGCHISGNGSGVNNYLGEPLDATLNDWGHLSGPHHPSEWYYFGTVKITNPDGLGDAVTDYVLYSPWTGQEDGFVTGGGTIWSKAGDYELDPEAEGQANFGFVSKTKKGAKVPDGSTNFVFDAGDLHFHSSDYDWLVVAGTTAKFKGTGTIEGLGDGFKFMLWAGDSDPDTFRILIWYGTEEEPEVLVYDNGPGNAITGGNIIIHKDTGKK